MASYNASLSVLAAFIFDTPDHWPKWKRHCLGKEAEDILASTNIGEEDRKKYDSVVAKFDSFFSVRKNVIVECAKFNKRSQLPDKLVEQFIASLYNLAVDCNFGELKDELIRDRIVVGIRDASLSERLQMDQELMLEKVKTVVRQREAVREQQVTITWDRLESPQLLYLKLWNRRTIKVQKSRQVHFHRSDVLDVARINIHVMPALQKRLLAENARRKASCCDVSN